MTVVTYEERLEDPYRDAWRQGGHHGHRGHRGCDNLGHGGCHHGRGYYGGNRYGTSTPVDIYILDRFRKYFFLICKECYHYVMPFHEKSSFCYQTLS